MAEAAGAVVDAGVQRWFDAIGRTLMACSPLALAVYDDDLRYVLLNDRAVEMAGHPREAMLGRRPTDVHGPAAAASEALYRQVRDTGEPVVGERMSLLLPTDGGRARHWRVTCTPLPPGGPGGVVVLGEEITDRVDAEAARDRAMDALWAQARRDALTGLPNRIALGEWWTARAARGMPAEVVYADLDGFKAVNDRNGHAYGDEVLVRVAQALRAATREDEALARVGGDEFVALTADDGFDLASRLTVAVREVAAADPRTARVDVSCGVGYLMPHDPLELGIERADREMYQRKAARRLA